MEKNSVRAIETKESLKNAFFKLYEERTIDRISIKELTDLAGRNRGTFYIYYKDIYDLLESAENDLFNQIRDKLSVVLSSLLAGEDFEEQLPSLDFFEKNIKYLKILFGKNMESGVIVKVKDMAKAFLRQSFSSVPPDNRVFLEYALEYIASAQTSMIKRWILSDMNISISEMASMMKAINRHGVITFLAELDES